jgi:hypothetical protein
MITRGLSRQEFLTEFLASRPIAGRPAATGSRGFASAAPGLTLPGMSIVWSLKRLFDPAAYFREEGEQHAEREQPRHTHAGDPPRFEVTARTAEQGPPRFCCRVCGYESQGSAYCPECLADTMMKPAGEA